MTGVNWVQVDPATGLYSEHMYFLSLHDKVLTYLALIFVKRVHLFAPIGALYVTINTYIKTTTKTDEMMINKSHPIGPGFILVKYSHRHLPCLHFLNLGINNNLRIDQHYKN